MTPPPNSAAVETGADGAVAAALARLRGACRRPGFGHSRSRSVTTLVGRLRAESNDGHAVVHTDLPAALGGEASAPSPTVLVRCALGACLAMGYRLRAAELGVELTDIRVTVESESQLGGMLDADSGAPPGFSSLRYRVEIVSPAPEEVVERIVDAGDRVSPVLDMLTRAHAVERAVSIERA